MLENLLINLHSSFNNMVFGSLLNKNIEIIEKENMKTLEEKLNFLYMLKIAKKLNNAESRIKTIQVEYKELTIVPKEENLYIRITNKLFKENEENCKVLIGLEEKINKLREKNLEIPSYIIINELAEENELNAYIFKTTMNFVSNIFYNLSAFDKENYQNLDLKEKIEVSKYLSFLSDLKDFNEIFQLKKIERNIENYHLTIKERLKNYFRKIEYGKTLGLEIKEEENNRKNYLVSFSTILLR